VGERLPGIPEKRFVEGDDRFRLCGLLPTWEHHPDDPGEQEPERCQPADQSREVQVIHEGSLPSPDRWTKPFDRLLGAKEAGGPMPIG